MFVLNENGNGNRASRRARGKNPTGKFLDGARRADRRVQAKNPGLAPLVDGGGKVLMDRGGVTAVLPTVDGDTRAYRLVRVWEHKFIPTPPPVPSSPKAQIKAASDAMLNALVRVERVHGSITDIAAQ
jgi:hypothetical protein